jgi:hypothetical protein
LTWAPANAATDIRPLSPNLLQFFRDNQTEVLDWANGGPGLDDFQVIYNTDEGSHQNSIFPNLQVFSESHRTTFRNDGLHVEYSLTLIAEMAGTDATQLRLDAKNYGYALESMLMNVPTATLMNGLSGYTKPNVTELSVDHNPLLKGEEGNWLIPLFLKFNLSFTLNP